MAYELPGGIAWCKSHLKVIHQNEDLFKIQEFGDLWRGRGHVPLLHVVSPAMDYDFNTHEDASGLVDNIPAHIDLLIVDFNNKVEPEIVGNWINNGGNHWKLWEYKAGFVVYNGTYAQFLQEFKEDPAEIGDPVIPGDPGGVITPGGTITLKVEMDVYHHFGSKK